MRSPIHLVECPRDAMQGWPKAISTAQKAAYLNLLLQVGFDTLDCGSFVSAKDIPQMADTKTVLQEIDWKNSSTKLLCIVANERGAEEAMAFPQVQYLGFPFSISPTFQQRNTNSTMPQSWERVLHIRDLCVANERQPVIYLSMAFGNPYGDAWNESIVADWAGKMYEAGIRIISVADTVGLATAAQISSVLERLIPNLPGATVGVHLHSTQQNWREKMDAAYKAGCRRFDGALKGIGGCPMANDELVGNMDTELMLSYFKEQNISTRIDHDALARAAAMASEIFA